MKAHSQVVREVAAEGTVLLKNNGHLLPLKSMEKVALFGCGSYRLIAGGTGSGDVNKAYIVSLVEGMRKAGFNVDDDLVTEYTEYLRVYDEKMSKLEWWQRNPIAPEFIPKTLPDVVKNNNIAVITIQRQSGEGHDRPAADFDLDADDRALLTQVSDAFHKAGKKVVVVLNVGGAIETASWKDIPDAILLPWQCGQEIGHSVADMLVGKVAPSGHLPMTFPEKLSDHASTKNFPLDSPDISGWGDEGKSDRKNIDYTNYEEGIYVGYRWFDKQGLSVSYPFGYGLTYTSFEFDGLKLGVKQGTAPSDEVIEVSVNVKNTGKAAGKQVVQVYVTAPKGNQDKPVQELKGFAKTRLLKPGESQVVTVCIPKMDLASFYAKKSVWVVDAGTYIFRVGDNSRNILCEGTMKIKKQQEKVSVSL